MSAWLDASTSMALLVEPNGSHDTAIVSVQLLVANEQKKEQMQDWVSTVEILPNTSERTAADLVFHQSRVGPPRKSILVSRLSSWNPKKAIVECLRNKVSVEEARKCSVFKFSPARQSDIASFGSFI